jgi:hypothetical protein
MNSVKECLILIMEEKRKKKTHEILQEILISACGKEESS